MEKQTVIYPHTGVSVIKSNELSMNATMQVNHKGVMLTKKSQSQMLHTV